jgi:flavin-dependent dehydrogenase
MHESNKYDAAIVGGGMAGLSTAILLAKNNFRVALFEKETYPFHKVCGEYISLESYDFLMSLGLALAEKHLPVIKELTLSSSKGSLLHQGLPLGGFGISRYVIDDELAMIAKSNGVEVFDNNRVNEIIYKDDSFSIQSDKLLIEAKIVCAAFGKRSNLDVKWKRLFVQQKPNALNNYIAVKYHAEIDQPRNNIALHNFSDGYCGISPIEDGKSCICYLTTAQNLKNNGNSIQQMERNILYKNPFLKKAFAEAKMLYDKPLAISQVSFDKKDQVHDHILFLGDAAGLIAPLCGNGMSMALFSGKIAAGLIAQFLTAEINRQELERRYVIAWKNSFSSRLHAGRIIQSVFGRDWLTNSAVLILRRFPALVSRIIRQTHG